MYQSEQKVTIELVKTKAEQNQKSSISFNMSNPINNNSESNKISQMVNTILDSEFPELKNNSLIHDLVFYNILEKMNTVQTVENVLSCMKSNQAKKIDDVYFKNGEIRIQCSI